MLVVVDPFFLAVVVIFSNSRGGGGGGGSITTITILRRFLLDKTRHKKPPYKLLGFPPLLPVIADILNCCVSRADGSPLK